MKKIIAVLISCVMMFAIFTSCRNNVKDEQGSEFKIITSFYPMYIFTLNIIDGIDGVSVKNMTEQDVGCLHDYQLLPDDMKALSYADIFIINGAGMESFLDKVTGELPSLIVAQASEGIKFIRDNNGEGSGTNSHVWMSVPLAIAEVNNIAAALAKSDPLHAEDYKNNADAYVRRLEMLHKEMKESLKDIKGTGVIAFHDAFPYFAEEYGLYVAGVIESEQGKEPGAHELAETIEIIRDKNVKFILSDKYTPSIVKTIEKETGAKALVLDPFVSGTDGLTHYENVMNENMKVLLNATLNR